MEFKFKSTIPKEQKDPYKALHKRRQSEDFTQKPKRKDSAKKK